MKTSMKWAAFFARILPSPIKRWVYRIKPLAKIIRNRLNATIPEGIIEVEVAAGILQGACLKLDLQQEKDYWLGTYELDLQAAAKKYVKPGMCIYDVGANIGYMSLLFSKILDERGKVFAFEALPENIRRLEENIQCNAFGKLIHVIPAAIVEKSGLTEFYQHASGAMGKAVGSAGRQEAYQNTITVQALSLDDFVFVKKQAKPNLVKMDIEGGEALALQGMQKLLGKVKPILFIEIHGDVAGQIAWKILKKFAYQILRMGEGQEKITTRDQIQPKDYLIALPPQK